MRFRRAVLSIALLVASMAGASAAQPPAYRSAGAWTGRCLSTGLCAIASGPVQIVRGWAWDAEPSVCADDSGDADAEVAMDVDGRRYALPLRPDLTALDATQIAVGHHAFEAYVRQEVRAGRSACLRRHLESALVHALAHGRQAVLLRSGVSVPVPLEGFAAMAAWLDARQARTGTAGAIVDAGGGPPQDAVHAAPLLETDALPRAVDAAYREGPAACPAITGTAFDSGGAARIALGGGFELFLLPCGDAYDQQPVRAIVLRPDGQAQTQALESVRDGRPVAGRAPVDLVWDGLNRSLVSRRSEGPSCVVETVWHQDGDRFLLQRQRQWIGCVQAAATAPKTWMDVWPAPAGGEARLSADRPPG